MDTNTLAKRNGNMGESALSAYNPEQLALLKEQIAPGCSDNELILFCEVAKRTGLDPFMRQVYAIKRKDKMTIQTSIDGFRLIADRTGQMDGSDAYWCGEDGIWKDVWVSNSRPVAAKVEVYKKGCSRVFKGVAKWDEYAQYYNGSPSQMWSKFPTTMLAKCAEALALRKAFPAELSGIYTGDEMSQANTSEHDYTTIRNESNFKAPSPSVAPNQTRNNIKEWVEWVSSALSKEDCKSICKAKFATESTLELTDKQLVELRDSLFMAWGYTHEGLFKAKKHCQAAYQKAITGIDVDADEVIFRAWEDDIQRRINELNAGLEDAIDGVLPIEVVPGNQSVSTDSPTDKGEDF